MTTRTKKLPQLSQRDQLTLSEVEAWDDERRHFFWSMVDQGESVSMAAMLAAQQSPMSLTDAVMMTGQTRIGQLDEKIRKKICEAAEKQGYKPKPTDSYMPTMARSLGDPDAFFNKGEGLGKIREVCKRRKIRSDGIISVDHTQEPLKDPFDHPPRLHKRIRNRIKGQMLKEDPGLRFRKSSREIDEMIVDRHAPKSKLRRD